jgi:phage head maturation protease
MNEKVENLVLEHLRAIRADMARLSDDMRGLRTEMMSVRHHTRGLELSQDVDRGDLASMKVRLDRIEKRLELADAQ